MILVKVYANPEFSRKDQSDTKFWKSEVQSTNSKEKRLFQKLIFFWEKYSQCIHKKGQK